MEGKSGDGKERSSSWRLKLGMFRLESGSFSEQEDQLTNHRSTHVKGVGFTIAQHLTDVFPEVIPV